MMGRFMAWLFFVVGVSLSSGQELRVFRHVSGRTIEAKPVSYDPAGGIVTLERGNGKVGNIPLKELSEDDQEFVNQWRLKAAFLDEKQLEIKITENSSNWEKVQDGRGLPRHQKTTTFDILLINHTPDDFSTVHAEYCLYTDRRDYIDARNYEVEISALKAGTASQAGSPVTHLSYKQSSTGDLCEIDGARFRFTLQLPDGSSAVREICYPEKLSLEKYPWVIGEQEQELMKADAPGPESYPDIEMTEDDVKELARAYIKAYEKDDFEAWKKLLSPMHPGDSLLSDHTFQWYRTRMKGMKIEKVDGLKVELGIRTSIRTDGGEWLLLHSSGHIKYTPLVFRHPVIKALDYVSDLKQGDSSIRTKRIGQLEELGIPTFGYQVNGVTGDQMQSIQKMMMWFQENGTMYDSTLPEVYLPQDALNDAYGKAKKRIDPFGQFL